MCICRGRVRAKKRVRRVWVVLRQAEEAARAQMAKLAPLQGRSLLQKQEGRLRPFRGILVFFFFFFLYQAEPSQSDQGVLYYLHSHLGSPFTQTGGPPCYHSGHCPFTEASIQPSPQLENLVHPWCSDAHPNTHAPAPGAGARTPQPGPLCTLLPQVALLSGPFTWFPMFP